MPANNPLHPISENEVVDATELSRALRERLVERTAAPDAIDVEAGLWAHEQDWLHAIADA